MSDLRLDVSSRQLRAFLTIAELGSFSKAGERLHMAQPAVSQLIRDLEQRLAIKLFDRSTRRVELTEGGRDFQMTAMKILQDLDAAVQRASERAQGRRGRVTVAAPPLLAASILPQVIAEFTRANPEVQIVLVDASTDQIIDWVRTNRADWGLGTFPPALSGIDRSRLARDQLMAFVRSTDNWGKRRKLIVWPDLIERPLITLTRGSGIRLLVEVGFEAAQVPLVPVYEVNQITTALSLVEAGLGLAVLPAYARAATASRQILGRPISRPTIARDIDLIHASGHPHTPAAISFQTVLRRHMQSLR